VPLDAAAFIFVALCFFASEGGNFQNIDLI